MEIQRDLLLKLIKNLGKGQKEDQRLIELFFSSINFQLDISGLQKVSTSQEYTNGELCNKITIQLKRDTIAIYAFEDHFSITDDSKSKQYIMARNYKYGEKKQVIHGPSDMLMLDSGSINICFVSDQNMGGIDNHSRQKFRSYGISISDCDKNLLAERINYKGYASRIPENEGESQYQYIWNRIIRGERRLVESINYYSNHFSIVHLLHHVTDENNYLLAGANLGEKNYATIIDRLDPEEIELCREIGVVLPTDTKGPNISIKCGYTTGDDAHCADIKILLKSGWLSIAAHEDGELYKAFVASTSNHSITFDCLAAIRRELQKLLDGKPYLPVALFYIDVLTERKKYRRIVGTIFGDYYYNQDWLDTIISGAKSNYLLDDGAILAIKDYLLEKAPDIARNLKYTDIYTLLTGDWPHFEL